MANSPPPGWLPGGFLSGVACGFFALSLAGTALATTIPKGAEPLTVDQVVAVALERNPDILTARQEIERTLGQVVEVRAQALPQAVLAGNYDQQDKELAGGGVGGLFGQRDKSWRVALQGRQLLYSGGQVSAALRIAQASKESAFFQLQDTIDRIIAEARTQFYTIVLNRALIGVQEESVELLQQELNDQTTRFEAGTVPRFNVLRAEVELANARPDLIRARNDYRISQLRLARLLGADYSERDAWQLPYEPVGELLFTPRELELAPAVRLAKERRPFLKAQRQNILIEADQIRVALAGYKPRVEAVAGYEFRNDSSNDSLSASIEGWFLGAEASWRIFDGLETAGQVQQAKARLEAATIAYDDSVRQVELEVQTALSRLQEARELIDSQQKTVEQADEALRLARERFSAGAGTQLDVLDARVALTRARTTELRARWEYNVALAEFERATAMATDYEDRFADPLVQANRSGAPRSAVRGGSPGR